MGAYEGECWACVQWEGLPWVPMRESAGPVSSGRGFHGCL